MGARGGPSGVRRDAPRLAGRRELGELDPADREKVDDHPMRVLDSKRPTTQAVVVDAPRITDHLSPSSRAHFDRVQEGLDALGIPYTARTRDWSEASTTTPTPPSSSSAERSTPPRAPSLGGGRYDGLVEPSWAVPTTPGIGFGSGIERVLLACDAEGVFDGPDRRVDVFVVDTTGGDPARDPPTELRRAGLRAERAFDQRSMKSRR